MMIFDSSVQPCPAVPVRCAGTPTMLFSGRSTTRNGVNVSLTRTHRPSSVPHPVLDDARSALNAHYGDELGGQFVSAGLCLYRDGHDSVAWHGDRIARESPSDTMVAILSLGAVRPFALRPKSGGPALRLQI